MQGKIKRFFKKNGFYLGLLVCVIAVLAAGISILSRRQNEPDQPVIAYSTQTAGARTPGSYRTPAPGTPTARPSAEPSGKPTDGEAFHPVTPGPSGTGKPGTTPGGQAVKIQLTKPLDGAVQVDYSGKKLVFNKTTKEWRTHPGVDIAGSDGAPIRAAAAGTVSAVKDDPRYGQTVILDHGNDLYTVYCGFGAVAVREGAQVREGDTLGTLGAEIFCEREQGLHLHFEVLSGGSSLDPNSLWR